eukprot:160608-Chlamydomonas_euryale.AAC.1
MPHQGVRVCRRGRRRLRHRVCAIQRCRGRCAQSAAASCPPFCACGRRPSWRRAADATPPRPQGRPSRASLSAPCGPEGGT